MAHLFIFGLGYSAKRIRAATEARGWQVTATGRDGELGFEDDKAVRAALGAASHVLSSVPPDEAGDPVLAHYGDALRHGWLGYLSSTGVYGDTGGAWVDETAPTIPPHTRGAARVDAELAWQALGRQRRIPVAILRLGGIYGPGQNAFVRLIAGRAHRIDKPGHVANRIHVADIAQAIDAAFARRFDGIVNVTDCEPAPPGDQIEFAAKLLGVAPPPLLSLDEAKRTLSPFLMSFYDGCARVRNDKLKNVLGVTLRYPDYRAGLQALRGDGFAAAPEI